MIIAILSQSGHTIGLFEHIRIFQNDSHILNVLKSVRGRMDQWVVPSAELIRCVIPTYTSSIRVIGGEGIHVDANVTVWSHQVFDAAISKLQYTVSFWNQQDSYPVYTLTPQHFLPWSSTVRTEVQTRPVLYRTVKPRVRPDLAADAMCAITLMELTLNTAYTLSCGHSFSDAIFRALELDERCPLCRKPTLLEDIVH